MVLKLPFVAGIVPLLGSVAGKKEPHAPPNKVTFSWKAVELSNAPLRPLFEGAVSAAGPGLSDILWRVVCAGETLPLAEREMAWPVRSGKLVLRLALDRVAGAYRLV